MGTVTSTYGIDIRRKILVSRGTDFNMEYWLRGNLDPKSLKDMSFKYKETLKPAQEGMEKAYNEITTPIREALNFSKKLFKSVGMGKGAENSNADAGGGDKDDTRMAMMEYVAALASIMQGISPSAGVDAQLQKALATQLNLLPKYNIPVRTEMPTVGFPLGKDITIQFHTGSCNWWNAYTEVYEPVTEIMKAIFPQPKTHPSYDSLYTLENANNAIPFEIQTKYFLVTNLLTSAEATIPGGSMAGLASKVMDTGKNAMEEAQKALEEAKELKAKQRELEAQARLVALNNTADKKGAWSFLSWVADGIDGEKNAKALQEVREKQQKQAEKASRYLDPVISYLGTIANFGEALIGNASAELTNSLPICHIAMMMVPKSAAVNAGPIYFSMQDIIDAIVKGIYKPAITISGILQEVEASFDFSDVDEAGYPNSGTIKIGKIWAVNSMGTNMTFNVADKATGYLASPENPTTTAGNFKTKQNTLYTEAKSSGKKNWEQIADLINNPS